MSRAKRFSRTAIFIPYAVPGVIASLLWGFMYLPSTSPFCYITKELGLGEIPFLGAGGIYPSIANIAVWGGVGFNMIIIYTSLRGIPSELYEAARIDGANEWQIAWRIKIPLVAPALVLTGLFALIGTLQVYGEPTTLQPMTNEISADLGAADEHLPRRLRPRRPVAGRGRLRPSRGRDAGRLGRAPEVTQKRAFGG